MTSSLGSNDERDNTEMAECVVFNNPPPPLIIFCCAKGVILPSSLPEESKNIVVSLTRLIRRS